MHYTIKAGFLLCRSVVIIALAIIMFAEYADNLNVIWLIISTTERLDSHGGNNHDKCHQISKTCSHFMYT